MVAIVPIIISHPHDSPIEPRPSTTSNVRFTGNTTLPSPLPTSKSNFKSFWSDLDPPVIFGIVIFGVALIAFVVTIVPICCSGCSGRKRSRRSGNTTQERQSPTNAQNRWYDRLKSRSGSSSSGNQSPEVIADVPLERLRSDSRCQSSAHQFDSDAAPSTSSPSRQPPHTANQHNHSEFSSTPTTIRHKLLSTLCKRLPPCHYTTGGITMNFTSGNPESQPLKRLVRWILVLRLHRRIQGIGTPGRH
ncbi:hypothetical protein N431DRAFT_564910 [Stipitochalara longipes BDJ]|nr:hypothetical protein N431DRAFT_564910 [Stipitochalara longipes BDJ]